jgi:hypothetical protein
MSEAEASPLRQLAEATGRDFPHLFEARERTESGLAERGASLRRLDHSAEASIVLMGSWGRAEVTAGSDDDFMVLVHGREGLEGEPTVEAVSKILDHAPGSQGTFADQVFSEKLVQNIGLDRDDNRNLTRRMLFLLESTSVTGDEIYRRARKEILDRYLDESVKPFRPPRFLLNDIVRYWRTICVDFAGGLLPTLECFRFDRLPMREFVERQLGMPPTDRIAAAFLQNGAKDEGARTLGAYDEFVGWMDDPTFRQALQGVTRENADRAESFSEARRIGREVQAGLLALLYEASRELSKVARDYAIF